MSSLDVFLQEVVAYKNLDPIGLKFVSLLHDFKCLIHVKSQYSRIGLVLLFACLWILTSSWFLDIPKKELGQYQVILTIHSHNMCYYALLSCELKGFST